MAKWPMRGSDHSRLVPKVISECDCKATSSCLLGVHRDNFVNRNRELLCRNYGSEILRSIEVMFILRFLSHIYFLF